jgi:uncharacterized protein involved in exopolysaccharide biosynthesis
MSPDSRSSIFENLKTGLRRPVQIGLAAALLTALVVLFIPNSYRSEARLLPVEARGGSGMGQFAGAAAALGLGLPGESGPDANFVDVLNSRWMRENLLATEFQFHFRSWRFGADRARQETLYAFLDEKNLDRAVKRMDQVLAVSRDLKSKVVTFSAETRSPELSREIVRRATALLDQFEQQKGRTRGGEKAAFAEARLAEARKEMAQAEGVLQGFLENNRNYQVSADPAVRLRGERLSMELRLRQQLVTTLALNREEALLQAKDDVPILNVLDAGNLPIEKSGPARAMLVLGMFMLATAGALGWGMRDRLRAFLRDE